VLFVCHFSFIPFRGLWGSRFALLLAIRCHVAVNTSIRKQVGQSENKLPLEWRVLRMFCPAHTFLLPTQAAQMSTTTSLLVYSHASVSCHLMAGLQRSQLWTRVQHRGMAGSCGEYLAPHINPIAQNKYKPVNEVERWNWTTRSAPC